jgi:hypothetical protein
MKRLFKEIAITSSAGTITLNATDMTNEYCIIGSDVTINTGLNITMSGMSKGHAVKIYWSQKVTRGSNTITVLDKVLTDTVVDNIVLLAMYNGTTWDVWELPAELDKLITKDPDGNVTWGTGTTTSGTNATSWGRDTTSTGDDATAFGNGSTASGAKSTAFGETSEASGANATSFGKSSEASGESATAFGEGCIASGDYSTAFGYYTTASGDYSTAFGIQTTASGDNSTAFGLQTISSGSESTAFGNLSQANGGNSTAFGYACTANGAESTTFGRSNVADGNMSTAFGNLTTATGNYTTTFGYYNEAHDYIETTFGRFATISNGSTESWSATDSLFKIGIGANDGARADALKMLKNGNTTVTGIWTFVSGISYTNPNLSATTVEEALDEIVELILSS